MTHFFKSIYFYVFLLLYIFTPSLMYTPTHDVSIHTGLHIAQRTSVHLILEFGCHMRGECLNSLCITAFA